MGQNTDTKEVQQTTYACRWIQITICLTEPEYKDTVEFGELNTKKQWMDQTVTTYRVLYVTELHEGLSLWFQQKQAVLLHGQRSMMATSCLQALGTIVQRSYASTESKNRSQGLNTTITVFYSGTPKPVASTFLVLLITVIENSTALSAQSELSKVQSSA